MRVRNISFPRYVLMDLQENFTKATQFRQGPWAHENLLPASIFFPGKLTGTTYLQK